MWNSQAETIQKYLYPSLGDFDVYMSISTKEGAREPRVGDQSACASLTPPPPARMFCEVISEEQLPLMNDDVWHTFYYHDQPRGQQGLLQQLLGQQRCAMMMARQVIESNVGYRYAVRVRPDLAFFAPFPPVATLFQAGSRSIKFNNAALCCCGNEDTFGAGEFFPMTLYFNRIVGLHHASAGFLKVTPWAAETFLLEYMKTNFGVALEEDRRIAACIVKPLYRAQISDP